MLRALEAKDCTVQLIKDPKERNTSTGISSDEQTRPLARGQRESCFQEVTHSRLSGFRQNPWPGSVLGEGGERHLSRPRNELWEPNTLLSPGNNRNTSSVRLHVTVRKCFPRFRVKGLIKQTSNSQTLTKDTELIFTDFLRVHKLHSERTYTVGAELLPVSRGRPRGTTAKI